MTILRRLRTPISVPVCAVLVLDAVVLGLSESASALSLIALLATICVVLWLRRELTVSERRGAAAPAQRDELTGLPDRSAFDEALGRELSRAPLRGPEVDDQTALVFVSLNRFGSVNDLHGRAVGDLVLQSLAGALTATLRPHDVLTRIDGDQFAIVASRTGALGAKRIVQRLEEAVASVVPATGAEPLSAAVVYVLLGIDGEDVESLMHVAAVRLQTAKDEGLDSALASLLG